MPDVDDRSIHQLDTVTDSLITESTETEITTQNAGMWVSFKSSLGAIFDKILRSVSFTQRLNTNNKTVFGAINELQAGGGGGSSTPLVVNGTVEEGETYGVLYDGETVTTFEAAWLQNRMSVLMVDNFMGIEENELILTYVGKIYNSSLNVYDYFFVINQTDNNGQPVMNVVTMRAGDLDSGYQKFYCYSFNLMDKKEVSGTLTAGSTSLTLSDAAITSSSTIQVFTDPPEVPRSAPMTVSTGSVTLTFEAQQSNVSVKVRIS